MKKKKYIVLIPLPSLIKIFVRSFFRTTIYLFSHKDEIRKDGLWVSWPGLLCV